MLEEVLGIPVGADGTRDSAGLAGTLEAAVSRAALTAALGAQLPDDDLERALASARSALASEVELRRAELAADVLLIGAASIPLERVIGELPALG